MTIASLQTLSLDYNTRAEVISNAEPRSRNDGYLYFIRTTDAGVISTDQYVNIIALYTYSGGTIRSSLLSKFFPRGTLQMFAVPVPRLEEFNNVDVSIILQPKEFYSQGGQFRMFDVELLWEENRVFNANAVSLGGPI